jgi:hypothetical protein
MATKKSATKTSAKKPAPQANDDEIPRAYPITMSSVQALENRCETDESGLTARITSLQLATDDGEKVTGATYTPDEETELGELSIEEYKTDVDISSLKAIHQTKGDEFLFKGEAYVKTNPIKVLVFREGEARG